MRNYLLRLGWSHDDDEIISTAQAIEWFNLESIGQSPARMDFKKMANLNGHYMREADDHRLADAALKIVTARGTPVQAETPSRLLAAMPGLKERAKTLVELADGIHYLTAARPLQLDDKAQKLMTQEAKAMLAAVLPVLERATWTAPELETAVKDFAESKGWKLGNLAQPLRAALTGRTTSPGIYDVLGVLGANESLARIRDQI
jgi:glutamyl-tRNA synthetase